MKPFAPKSGTLAPPAAASHRHHRPPRIPKENLDPNSVAAADSSPFRPPIPAAKPKNRITLPPRPPLASQNQRNTPLKRKLSLESPSKNAACQPPSAASDSGVQVIVRVRPRSKTEDEGEVIVQKVLPNSVSIADHVFTFDSVADTNATQEDIFELVGLPLVENCLAGFNSSIFAYGQTGSGKTYTMWGPLSALPEDASMSKEQGLTPRVFERLFARIKEEQTKHFDKQLHCQCRCSFLEIYNEQITDLLDPTHRNLQIREDIKSGVYVDYLTEEVVSNMKNVTGLLTKGLANRRTGATNINIESSRSHCVFTCVIEFRSKSMADGPTRLRTSRINLVDLAGSERQKQTGAGGERLKEAGNINRSLSQLGNLINILAEVSHTGKQRHIPYRDSKLTFLLQESLGGNAKMAMICAISPSQRCKSETFSTLRFAQSTKAIKNRAVVNEVTQDDVNVLREQIRQLKDEIVRMKSNGMATNGSYSTAWNARHSLTLIKMSLNRPRTLPILRDDSDEEMEIDENDVEKPCNQAVSMPSFNSDRVPADLRISKSRVRSTRCGNGINFEGLSATSAMEASSGKKVGSGIGEYNTNKIGVNQVNLKAGGQVDSSDVNVDKQPESNFGDQENQILDFKHNGKNSPAKEEQNLLADQSYNCLSTPSVIVSCPLSIMPCQTSPSSPMSISPLVENSSRISPRTSSPNSAADKNPLKKLNSFAETSCVLTDSSSRASKHDIVPTEELEASLHRGLQVIDNMQYSPTLRSSFRFPATPIDTMPIISVNKVDAGVQTFMEKPNLEEKHTNVCCYCKSGTSFDKRKDRADATDMQLVLVEGSVPADSEKLKMQVPKVVKKVLSGSIRREMALEEQCANQAYEIVQLNRLVEQYKHERECNVLITQTREEKISRLESLMDGILPTKEFLEEEFISLANEHKILNEKYDHHPEVLRVNIELKRLQEELDGYKNFFDFGEREILFKEIQQLRSQLQYYLDSSSNPTQNSTLMLKLTDSVGSTLDPLSVFLHTVEENADEKVEVARCNWTENESKWISLTEELRLELEANKSLVKKHRLELDAEKKCTEELKEALQTAMQGHACILEQYADLQEKHIALLAWEQRISDGIEDIKSTAAKASFRDDESNTIDSLAAEISVLRAEREKHRLYWKNENEGLQAQLKDTAEAVQAAGELLVRLKEAEEAVAAAEKKTFLSEQKTKEAYQEMDNLKKNYESEIVLLNQKLVQSYTTKEAPGTAELKLLESANYHDRNGLNEQRWKDDPEDFCERGDTEPSKDTDPKSWFFGYDRCNI